MAGGGIGVICALTSEAPKSSATTKSHSHKEVFRIPSGPEATSARALLRGLILVNELPQGERVAEKVRRASAMPIDVSSLIHIPPGGIWARLCRICDTPRPPIILTPIRVERPPSADHRTWSDNRGAEKAHGNPNRLSVHCACGNARWLSPPCSQYSQKERNHDSHPQKVSPKCWRGGHRRRRWQCHSTRQREDHCQGRGPRAQGLQRRASQTNDVLHPSQG